MPKIKIILLKTVLLFFSSTVLSQNINYTSNLFYLGNSCILPPQNIVVCSNNLCSIQIKNDSGLVYFTYNKTNVGCDTIIIPNFVLQHCMNPNVFNSTNRLIVEASQPITLYEGYIYSASQPFPSQFNFRLVPPIYLAGTANIMMSYTKQYLNPTNNLNYFESGTDLFLLGTIDTSKIRIYPKWAHPLLNSNPYYSLDVNPDGGYHEQKFNYNFSLSALQHYPPCLVVQDSSFSVKGKFITRTGMWGFGTGFSAYPWGLSVGYYFYPLAYEFLGKSYHTVPHATRAGDSLLAIAFHDSTVISLNGVVSTINRGEVFRTLLDSPGVWQANHPFSLVQISRHQQEDSVLYSSLFAYSVHPDSALITSTWYSTEIVPDSTPGEQSYLNLISPTNGVAYVKLDGVSLSSYFVPYASDTSWSYAQIPVTSVQHKLEADSGVLAYAYQYSLGCGVGFYVGGLEMKNTITSVASPIIKTDIIIYPNPVHNTLNIDFGDPYKIATQVTVKLFTIEGKCIQNSTSKNRRNLTLDISTLANGIYFVEINIDGTRVTKKFIKN
ncbi:MAG: T9SS type A sorting domain-containing protein [Bacteroidetes bacterium]|nr:T9SS type A sorting domain-containing protein [Bacteroidota bacterium]